MDIWTGSITAEADSPAARALKAPLEDLRLSTPASATPPPSVLSHLTSSLSTARLSLLTLVDPTRIPFFLAAGPSLELTTTSPTTAAYFRDLFLSALPTDTHTVEQSRIALLVRVSNDPPPASGSWKITELVIYGAITQLTPPGTGVLSTPCKHPPPTTELTPPNSSPPADTPAPTAILTVHALPLSSHHAFPTHLPKSPPTDDDAVFIAPNPQDILNPSISHSAKKRGAAVLDAAADPRKRAKTQQQQQQQQQARRPPPLSLLGGVALNRKARAESVDPRSRGVMIKRERSPSPSPSFAPLKRSLSSAKKEVYGEVETANRAELARVVVAGMRACGLRDYRSGRGKSIAVEEEEEEAERERREKEKAEYKEVYYHTIKAAVFALRNVIATGSVEAEKMKEVVDKLLAVFCEPPVIKTSGQLLLVGAEQE